MTSSRLKPLDNLWLMLETRDTPMHAGVLAIFHQPRGAGAGYCADLAAGMREAPAVAPWNCRLARSPSPELVEEKGFELDYHFRRSALPEPGGERELGRMVSRLHSVPLDRGRPLWEFHLIEGLEGGRFAFYIKIHHVLVEATNGIPALMATLAGSPRSKMTEPLWARPLSSSGAEDDLAEEAGNWSGRAAVDSLVSLGRATLGMARGALRDSDHNSFLFPRGTPKSTLNRRINAQRRFATQRFEEQRIADLAEATGSTVNEILTYLCGSSLRRFFKEYNALPDRSLVGMMPVSLRERSRHLGGNAIAGLRVPLGTHVGDPLARLEAVRESMAEVRADRASLPDNAVTSYVLMRAAPIYASQLGGVGQLVPPLFNLIVSNTPGAERPRYFRGARMEAIYPLSPLMQFSALSIDCVSYAGTLNIGFTGARDTLPHLQRMAVYLGRALEELEELLAEESA